MYGVRERLVLNALGFIQPTTLQAIRYYLRHKHHQFYTTNQIAAAIRCLIDEGKVGWRMSSRGTALYFMK